MKKTTTVSIEYSIWEELKEQAERDNRSISNYIETLILEKREESR